MFNFDKLRQIGYNDKAMFYTIIRSMPTEIRNVVYDINFKSTIPNWWFVNIPKNTNQQKPEIKVDIKRT